MTALTRGYIYCDGDPCTSQDPFEGDENETVTSLRAGLRSLGWRRINGKDYCPECVADRRWGVS